MAETMEVTQVCSLSYCDREALGPAKNTKEIVCRAHYNQDWAGKEFSPIRVYQKKHMDQTGRVCTTCDEYKGWDEFYTRSNRQRNKQAECKACMVARVKRNREARLAKNEPCTVAGCAGRAEVKGMCGTHYAQHYYNERKNTN